MKASRLLIALVLLAPSAAFAERHAKTIVRCCPFCSAPSLTLSEQLTQSDAAVLVQWVDGEPARSRQELAGRSRIWFDLPARGRRVVRATRGLTPVPLLPPAGLPSR